VNGYTTFLVPLLDGSEDRLPLPFRVVNNRLPARGLTHANVEECSGGQQPYDVELFHDGEGKCYFHGGWP
jgi:hypothetical protein